MKNIINIIKDDKGQAMIELALMLPLLVIIMMFLIITYELMDGTVNVQHNVRYELRKAVDEESGGVFRMITKNGAAHVPVPGDMKNILGRSSITGGEVKLSSFTGSYQGIMMNKYRGMYTRKINGSYY